MKKLTGIALATAAAGLLAIAPISASADTQMADNGKVHCSGVNACKGKSSCKTANNQCKGQNSCKGTGFVAVKRNVCDQLGGLVEEVEAE